jgi:excinuclease ABC subunit A
MTVEEAEEFFSAIPKIHRKMATLLDVGLGYIKLGQPATTLSGGEAQRVRSKRSADPGLSGLAVEDSDYRRGALEALPNDRDLRCAPTTGRTLYILDEPTTGLRFEHVKYLLGVLRRLVDQGNTMIVIEHNLDVIKTADWVIDLGPEGGNGGGKVVAMGTPEEVAKVEGSWTGRYLKGVLAVTK